MTARKAEGVDRTPAGSVDKFPHGHPTRYAYGCRCDKCRTGANREDAKRKLERMAGRPRSVPAGPVREHIAALIAKGYTPGRIAAVSGADRMTVRRLRAGKHATVLRRTAERILSVPLKGEAPVRMVSSVGAIRRVRALYALGHFTGRIAEECGYARDSIFYLVTGACEMVTVEKDRAVRAAYDRLSMTVGGSQKHRRMASEKGWAPPLAWDDDTIDDPNAVPVVDIPVTAGDPAEVAARWVAGEFVVLGRDSRREAIRLLFETTDLAPEEIGGRLEMSTEAVLVAWKRIQERAVEEGRVVPLRRDLVDEQTRDEMESAA